MFAEILAAGYAANLEAVRRQWERYHEENRAMRARFDAFIRQADHLKQQREQNVITLKSGEYRIEPCSDCAENTECDGGPF